MYSGVTRYAQVTGVAVCSLCLTWITTILRFYVRIGILKFFGREDWLTVAAMILFTIFCSLCLRANVYGLGAHMYNIPPSSLVTGFKIIFICELLYVVSTTVTKLSIAAYFLRLSSKQYQRTTIYCTLAVVLLFSTIYFFFLLFQCSPVSFLWDMYEDGHGKCLRNPILASVTYTHSGISALTDWIFGILPIFFVWKMQMNARTKLSVVLILSLGFFASTATIVRIVYIKRLTVTTDYSWEGINLVKWSMVEPAIAITAMNIATLRPMFKSFVLFASKRFDPTIEEDRDSGDYRKPLRDSGKTFNTNSINSNEYSAEFAEMLGLSRLGVTTEISAGGGSTPERKRLHSRYNKKGRPALMTHQTEKGFDSQTELSDLPIKRNDDVLESQGITPPAMDWNSIQYTTTIRQEVRE